MSTNTADGLVTVWFHDYAYWRFMDHLSEGTLTGVSPSLIEAMRQAQERRYGQGARRGIRVSLEDARALRDWCTTQYEQKRRELSRHLGGAALREARAINDLYLTARDGIDSAIWKHKEGQA